MKLETMGRIVSALVPGDFLLGADGWTRKLADWYDVNPYHRFDKGDILILQARNIFGYGIRPVAVIDSYEISEKHGRLMSKYNVTMHTDSNGDFFEWMKKNEFPQRVERKVECQRHFKWNIENQFKRVSVANVDEALALYRSRIKG